MDIQKPYSLLGYSKGQIGVMFFLYLGGKKQFIGVKKVHTPLGVYLVTPNCAAGFVSSLRTIVLID